VPFSSSFVSPSRFAERLPEKMARYVKTIYTSFHSSAPTSQLWASGRAAMKRSRESFGYEDVGTYIAPVHRESPAQAIVVTESRSNGALSTRTPDLREIAGVRTKKHPLQSITRFLSQLPFALTSCTPPNFRRIKIYKAIRTPVVPNGVPIDHINAAAHDRLRPRGRHRRTH